MFARKISRPERVETLSSPVSFITPLTLLGAAQQFATSYRSGNPKSRLGMSVPPSTSSTLPVRNAPAGEAR